jgi:hypothetical protein
MRRNVWRKDMIFLSSSIMGHVLEPLEIGRIVKIRQINRL